MNSWHLYKVRKLDFINMIGKITLKIEKEKKEIFLNNITDSLNSLNDKDSIGLLHIQKNSIY